MNVPGLTGYLEAQQQAQAQQQQQLQQAVMVHGLLASLQKQKQDEIVRQALAGSGGDVEKAAAAALRAGDYQAAAHLAPLAKMQQEQRMREETPKLLSQVANGQPSGGATTPGDAREARIAQLHQMSLIPQVANNPVVVQRLQAEIDRLTAEGYKPPQKRERIEGENLVQEEFDPAAKAWKEIGRGPRFARQVGPQPQERLVPVKEADGRIVYLPASQAAGREVGGRVTDVNLPKQVQQLGRDFEKAGLNQMIPVIQRAGAITPDVASYITGPKSLLPDAAVPQNIREARQDVTRLFNITLKDRSGAAVTNQELERLKEEFGKGVFKTPAQLMAAVSRAREIIDSHYAGIASSYGPEVLGEFNRNLEAVGGTPFQTRGKPATSPSAQPAAPEAQQGPYSDPDKEKRYQEWKARQRK